MMTAPHQREAVPTLFLDNCSLLDLMRDPTRSDMTAADRKAGMALLGAAERGELRCHLPKHAHDEFLCLHMKVEEEARAKVEILCRQIGTLNELASVYETPVEVDLDHLLRHVAIARGIVERWIAVLEIAQAEPQVIDRAGARVIAVRAPSQKGKESFKDCVIFETVIATARSLRQAGENGRFVFLSSNKNDYQTPARKTRPEIIEDLSVIKATYAVNMRVAKHDLGL